ncbi:MAG: ribosome-associated translation inhibitor RaiA [Candidatus Falkowbacteria bacterium]
MKYALKAKKVELTPRVKEYVDKKMQMLDKYLGKLQVIDCRVEVGLVVGGQKTGEIFQTEIILEMPHGLLVIAKHESDLFKSIDKAKDHLARSIVKYKERIIDRRRKGK